MKAKTWRILLFSWFALILLLGAIGCAVLYRYLAVYETARPEPVMDELMASMSSDDLYAAVKAECCASISEFEDASALLDTYYESSLRNAPLSYRKDTGSSDSEHAVFVVRLGSVNFARIVLTPEEDDEPGFGLHRWKLDAIEAGDILARLPALQVTIDTLPGQEIYVNGLPLGERYLENAAQPVADLGPLEQRFPVPPTLCRYSIQRMYGEISVTNAAGEPIAPQLDGDRVYFDAATTALHRIEFYVPSDLQVSLCGLTLSPEDAADRAPGIPEELAPYAGDGPFEKLHFAIDGLYSEPQLQVRDREGNVLEPVTTEAGTLHFYHTNDAALEEKASVYVSRFFSAYTRYSTRAYSVDGQASLLQRILPQTALYDYILNSKDTMIWAVTTTVNSYEDLRFTNFHALSEDCFVCTVRYKANLTMNARQGAQTYDEEIIAELCFVRTNGQYLCAAMSFVTD